MQYYPWFGRFYSPSNVRLSRQQTVFITESSLQPPVHYRWFHFKKLLTTKPWATHSRDAVPSHATWFLALQRHFLNHWVVACDMSLYWGYLCRQYVDGGICANSTQPSGIADYVSRRFLEIISAILVILGSTDGLHICLLTVILLKHICK